MKFRRGFKTQAEEISLEVRTELGLTPTAPLDPWALAEYLEIPIKPLTDLRDMVPASVDHFCNKDQSAFSAVTVFDGPRRMIVHNDSHSKGRQTSNLAHELSHALLLHPPTPPLSEHGCRLFDQSIEDEANWLGGCLLVPRRAAFGVVRRGLSLRSAAAHYGVSPKMMQYRLNVSGSIKVQQRTQRLRAK